jgi:hypothetical protein
MIWLQDLGFGIQNNPMYFMVPIVVPPLWLYPYVVRDPKSDSNTST